MPTPRISPAEPPYEATIAESFARIMPPGIEPLKLFRTMARNPRVLQRMFAGSLLDKGSVAMRDREIIILRTCARCNSEYEWGVHVAMFAQRVELSAQEIAATCDTVHGSDVWSPRDASLIGLTDALHDTASVSDAAWDKLMQFYTEEQALELIVLVGYYHTISFVTNALRIELESYAPRFRPGT
ncbi:MAG: carboxymuconolactone decarboxylase [Burkholderiales bacterium RIFCSPLOWO2_02_FULL_57_36]|nr:MAG: carboxymuconolactone decarboxylase [Burkholderiales bacterium RIFCSPLOWO2_02_FULL_57_36]